MDYFKETSWRFVRDNHVNLAFAATTFAASSLDSVFMFYYIKVFLNHYHVSESWFQTAQLLFLIWNMLNDPLFAYAQDHYNTAFNRYRRHIILYGAPIFALAFLTAWFPWADANSSASVWVSGIQLIVVLYLYDLMYTAVLLTHGCIHAELSTNSHDRIRRQQFTNAASVLGSVSVLLCEYFSNGLLNYGNFQATCVLIALVAWLSMTYTGLHCHTKYEIAHMENNNSKDIEFDIDRKTEHSIFALTKQLLTSPNFLLFVLVNFMAEFHKTFLSGFTAIFSDALLQNAALDSSTRSIFFGAVIVMPRILLACGGSFLKRYGYYSIYKITMISKVVFGISLYIYGGLTPFIYMSFVMLDSVMCGVGLGLMGLALPDLVDEDAEIYQRKHPLSSMVLGINALVTKPANSLAPMLVVRILNMYGYSAWQESGGSLERAPPKELTVAMFSMMCFVPVILGVMQLALWKRYTIQRSHLISSSSTTIA